jgi:hypothetical protein
MEFKLAHEKRIGCGGLIGNISIAAKRLVEGFGKPGDGDLDKTSGKYIFESEDVSLVTIAGQVQNMLNYLLNGCRGNYETLNSFSGRKGTRPDFN